MNPSILILEKDGIQATYLSRQFSKWGYSIFGVFDNELDAFLSLFKSSNIPTLTIWNLSSQPTSHFILLRLIYYLCNVRILIITGLRKNEIAPFLPEKIMFDTLYKPYTNLQLKEKIIFAISQNHQ